MQKLFYLLKAVHNPFNNEALAKCLYIDFLGFDVFDVQKIFHAVRTARGEYRKALFGIISDEKKLLSLDIPEDRVAALVGFAKLIADQKTAAENTDFVTFFSGFVRQIGFLPYVLGRADSVTGLKKIEKLFDEIKKESSSRSKFDFDDFIGYLTTMKKHSIIHIAAILLGTLFFILTVTGAMHFLDIANEVFALLMSANGDLSPSLVASGVKVAIMNVMISFPTFLLPLILSIIGIRKKGRYAFLSKIALWETIIGIVVMMVPIAYFFIRFSQL